MVPSLPLSRRETLVRQRDAKAFGLTKPLFTAMLAAAL
jgi:hypothetical protein